MNIAHRLAQPAHVDDHTVDASPEGVSTVGTVRQLYVDPTIPRFTRHDLVTEMNQRYDRYGFTDGTFRKWQEKGLICAPRRDHRWEEGRAGSDEGLWSDHDRLMLVALLERRERLRDELYEQFTLDKLSNLIVWSWVYFDGFVDLCQVRRALKTWAKPHVDRHAGPGSGWVVASLMAGLGFG